MTPRIMSIGAAMNLWNSPKRYVSICVKYRPKTLASRVARNMSTPSVTRIPHARIFWNSYVKNEWCVVLFFLAMGILYEKSESMQKERWEIFFLDFLLFFHRVHALSGEMSEWSIVHPWKGCVQQCTGGSNPPLSARFNEKMTMNG